MTSILLTAVLGLLVAHSAFGRGKAYQNWQVIKTYRLEHFISNALIIVIVITTAILLIDNVPYFDKNPILWVIAKIFGNGDGSGTGNIIFSGLKWRWFALLFLPVLMFAVPSLARAEEQAYREGTRNWMHGLIKSIRFGLLHLIMLIPLGAAVAVSIGGLWFTHQYFKGGVELSTTHHAMYNSIVVMLLFVPLLFA